MLEDGDLARHSRLNGRVVRVLRENGALVYVCIYVHMGTTVGSQGTSAKSGQPKIDKYLEVDSNQSPKCAVHTYA